MHLPGHQPANQQIALPLRKQISCVNGHTRRGNGRRPVQHWRHNAFTFPERRYPGAGVVQPVGSDRPAIIGARTDNIDFVSTTGTVLVGNQPALNAVVEQPLHIAVTIAVYFTLVGVVPCKRVVVRYTAIRVKAHNTANVVLTALGLLPVVETVSQG